MRRLVWAAVVAVGTFLLLFAFYGAVLATFGLSPSIALPLAATIGLWGARAMAVGEWRAAGGVGRED